MPRRRTYHSTDEPGTGHRSPGRVRFAAFLHLAMVAAFGLGIPAVFALTVWYGVRSLHLLWLPVGFLGLALARWWICAGTRCCICHQPLFLNRLTSKNRNAPALVPLGTHGTAALLAMTARSIRCPYCGRVNRLTGP